MSEISEITPVSAMKSNENNGVDAPIGGFSSSHLPGVHQSYRLDGCNYLQWVQLVRTFLKGKGHIRHLTEPSPQKSDPGFNAWDIEDSMIMSWLWNAMQPEVSRNYMFLSSTKDIWEMVRRTYSKIQDASVIYEIKMKLHNTNQGVSTITEYYNKMNGFWLELDHYQNIKMECRKDATILYSIFERDRVVEFLAGLNNSVLKGARR